MNRPIFERMIAPLRNRVQMMVARGVAQVIDDAGGIQALQLAVLDGELVEGAERFQDYGFTSKPFPGAEAVIVFPGGLRSHPLVVAVGDRRYRLRGLEDGEAAIYDDQGQVVILKREGVRLESPLKVEIESPEITATASTRFKVVSPTILLDGDVILGGNEGGKKVARHDDPVVLGKVVATTMKVSAL